MKLEIQVTLSSYVIILRRILDSKRWRKPEGTTPLTLPRLHRNLKIFKKRISRSPTPGSGIVYNKIKSVWLTHELVSYWKQKNQATRAFSVNVLRLCYIFLIVLSPILLIVNPLCNVRNCLFIYLMFMTKVRGKQVHVVNDLGVELERGRICIYK